METERIEEMKRLPSPAEMEARLRQIWSTSQHDQDPDLDLVSFGSRSNQDLQPVATSLNSRDLDPDGLNSKIRGKHAELLKTDPLYLLARSWKCHPATLSNATDRMGSDWVRKQIQFVMSKKGLSFPGRYLAKILAKNPF
jgi:hypothetical protein